MFITGCVYVCQNMKNAYIENGSLVCHHCLHCVSSLVFTFLYKSMLFFMFELISETSVSVFQVKCLTCNRVKRL